MSCIILNYRLFSQRIPFRPELRTKWIEAIAKHQEFDFSNASFMICELHFEEKEVLRSQPNDSHLKRGAVPSIFPTNYCEYVLKSNVKYSTEIFSLLS